MMIHRVTFVLHTHMPSAGPSHHLPARLVHNASSAVPRMLVLVRVEELEAEHDMEHADPDLVT